MGDVLEKCFGNIFVQGFRWAVFDDFGTVGRSVGRSVRWSVGPPSPPAPRAPKEVWSDIASSVCGLSLVWRR